MHIYILVVRQHIIMLFEYDLQNVSQRQAYRHFYGEFSSEITLEEFLASDGGGGGASPPSPPGPPELERLRFRLGDVDSTSWVWVCMCGARCECVCGATPRRRIVSCAGMYVLVGLL